MGYEFCFQQHDNVTRQSYFFNPSSTYLRVNKKPITLDVTVYIYIYIYIYISSFYFSLGTVFLFISEVLYSIPYPHHLNTTQKLKICFILKKGQYFKDNVFLGFIKPYGRQVLPREKEVKDVVLDLLLTSRVCFPAVF